MSAGRNSGGVRFAWRVVSVGVLTAALSVSVASASVVRTGSLNTTGSAFAVAVSGQTLAVGTVVIPQTGSVPSGTIDVFSEGASGWGDGTLVAQLTASDGVAGNDFGQSVAIDGGTIVALADQLGRASNTSIPPGVLYLFSEPAGGWSGTMHESARLVSGSATCTELSSASISGPTVTANCRTFGTFDTHDLVFSEPPGGWAGTVASSAQLSGATGVAAATDDGRTILAAGNCGLLHSCVLVFHEPAGGWRGTVSPSARLLLPTSAGAATIVAAGDNVFAAPVSSALDSLGRASVYVFASPGPSASGTAKPVATLAYPSNELEAGPSLAASGSAVAVTHDNVYGTKECIGDPTCSAVVTLAVFSRPKRGWAGTLTPQSVAPPTGAQIAVQDHTLLMSAGNVIEIAEARRPPAPSVSALTVAGLAPNRPQVHFNLSIPHGPEIVSVRVALPAGLRFTGSRRRVARAVTATRHHTITLSGGKLSVTLRSPHKTLGLAIGPGAMTESAALRRRIHHAHRPVRLTLTATVTDAAGDISRLPVRGSAGSRAAAR